MFKNPTRRFPSSPTDSKITASELPIALPSSPVSSLTYDVKTGELVRSTASLGSLVGDLADTIAATAQIVGAFPINPDSRDSALQITLNPGPYTVQVSGVGGTTGVCLVEVYEVPPSL